MPVAVGQGLSRYKDIDGFYKLQIEPKLKAWERQRVAAVRRRWIIIVTGLVAAAAIAAYVWRSPGMDETWYLLAGLVAVASIVIGLFATHGLRQEVKKLLTGKLATFYGFSYEAEPSRNPIDRFRALGLLPGHDREKIEDRWWGSAGDVAFDLVEAHLEDRETERDSDGKTSTKWETVFRGQLMTFSFGRAVAGPVIVRRDLGRLGNWIRAKFTEGEPVKFDDPEFERRFEVFAADAAAARALLDAELRQRIVAFAAERKVTLAFDGGDLLLALHGKDLFELGSFGRTLLDPGRFRKMAEELGIVFEVVERLELKAGAS